MNAIAYRFGKLLDEPNLAFLIITEMLFLQMVANNPIELGNQGGILVFLHITLICFLQMVILARLHRIARTRGVAAACVHRSIFAAFLVFNIYSVFLIHIPSESEIFVYKNHISVILLVVFLNDSKRRTLPASDDPVRYSARGAVRQKGLGLLKNPNPLQNAER